MINCDNIISKRAFKDIIFILGVMLAFLAFFSISNAKEKYDKEIKVEIDLASVDTDGIKAPKPVPRIDEEAAYIEKTGTVVAGNGGTGEAEPQKGNSERQIKIIANRNNVEIDSNGMGVFTRNFWLFIYAAYLFLLVFNLTYKFRESKELRWFWESLYTFLAIYAWDKLDLARLNEWFPAVIMESAIVIYIFYIFYFRNKSKDKDLESEKNISSI